MPKIIKCRKCGQVIELNADSYEARLARTDPYHQMRSHVQNCFTFNELVEHTRACGALLDMLKFHPESQHVDWWLQEITGLAEFLMDFSKVGK